MTFVIELVFELGGDRDDLRVMEFASRPSEVP